MEKHDTNAFIQYMFLPGNISEEGHNYFYFFRPGHKNFLLRLQMHPRIKLVFLSSMLSKNITPIFDKMLDSELSPVLENLKFFD